MAGGEGKRIATLDPTIPKPLLLINGKPILQWEIECLVRQGFTDIILTVSHMAEKIIHFFGTGENFGCKIEYFLEEQPLGNAGALFKLLENGSLRSDDSSSNDSNNGDFLLLNADSMFDVDFKRFISFHEEHKALATLFTHPNNHPYDSTLIVTSNDGVIRQWLTKEDERPEFYKNCVNAGLHILNTELLHLSNIVPESVCSTHKIDLDRDVLKPAISTARIYSYSSPEYVKDMGTPERFQQVCEDLESGKVHARNLAIPQKAIFLDRDGTINRNVGFLTKIEQFELLPGVAEAIRRINNSEYLCIVVTNQPVIARGEVTVEGLQEIHNKMETLLGEHGAYIDGLYYCPHHPDKGFEGEVPELKIVCDCRKPMPGLLFKAASDFNIDLGSSWFIGDTENDVWVGKNAGCASICLTGNNENTENTKNTENVDNEDADYVAPSLLDAVKYLLSYDNYDNRGMSMKISDLFWQSYLSLERDFLELAEFIFITDVKIIHNKAANQYDEQPYPHQLNTFSPHIADLLVQCCVQIEAISKELYYEIGEEYNTTANSQTATTNTAPSNNNESNAGNDNNSDDSGSNNNSNDKCEDKSGECLTFKPRGDKSILFDTDCLKEIDRKWATHDKTVLVTAFNLTDDKNKILKPLREAHKQGGTYWERAYQAVKHDRYNCLSSGNVKALLHALAALYLLNLYYKKDTWLTSYQDVNKLDMSCGSKIFAVKPPRTGGYDGSALWGRGNTPVPSDSPYVVTYQTAAFKRIENMQRQNRDALNNYLISQPEMKDESFLQHIFDLAHENKDFIFTRELAKFRLNKKIPVTLPFEERKRLLLESPEWHGRIHQTNKHTEPDDITEENIQKEIDIVGSHAGIDIEVEHQNFAWLKMALNDCICEVKIP